MTTDMTTKYSSVDETRRLLHQIVKLYPDDTKALVPQVHKQLRNVCFKATRDLPYFPIPFKETETASALKAIEGVTAAALATLKDGAPTREPVVTVDLEKTTAFLFQTYLATVGGLGKLDPQVKSLLKDTDLLQAQSDRYRRMSANLYETKRRGEYYHIHGSLEASTTFRMIGLEPFRPDLKTHEDIVNTIETAVQRFTREELEVLNARNRQAGVPALKHSDFLKTPHGQVNSKVLPWTVEALEFNSPPTPLPINGDARPLAGIKVLELCRIIAGPIITRILAEYGADVLKITSPHLSDVPFFQVDCNMGKRAAELDLKSPQGKAQFEKLLAEVDIVVDGYRPGALAKLGYGSEAMSELAVKRGKGIVYVNENCFGFEGEWANRPGWQQIADCVSGVAWAQGNFMGLSEPVVPPFPISDYGTGCMGAIAALTGLYHRTTQGGSWHGKTSLLHYDMLLFRAGIYSNQIQDELRALAGEDFLRLRHSHSVDQISGTALRNMKEKFPELFSRQNLYDTWYSAAYNADVVTVCPVVDIEGIKTGFRRASRPNGSDAATWDFATDADFRKGPMASEAKENLTSK